MFFEDYVAFTDILTSNDVEAKAMYSFKMLDHNDKGYIEEEDVHCMMSSLFELWTILTGYKIYLMPEYTRRVYRELDKDNDGRIVVKEYKQLYMKERLVFPWFSWFNQDEAFAKEVFANHEKAEDPFSPSATQIKGDLSQAMDNQRKQKMELNKKGFSA